MNSVADILLDWYARRRARPAVAPHARSLPHLALGGDSPADPRGAGNGVLSPLHGAVSRCRVARRRSRGRGAETLAGTRLLQPCPQSPCRRPAGRRTLRRTVPRRVGGGSLPARRGRLYRRGHLFGGLRRSVRRGRWQCLPGSRAALRPRCADRLHGRKARFRRTCAVAAGHRASGTLQSGDHGFRGASMHPFVAPLRGVPAGRTMPRPCCRNRRRASREAGKDPRPRPLVQLLARFVRRPDPDRAAARDATSGKGSTNFRSSKPKGPPNCRSSCACRSSANCWATLRGISCAASRCRNISFPTRRSMRSSTASKPSR